MSGRNKVLMISLVSLVLLGLGACWLLLDPDAGRNRPGASSKAQRSEAAQLSDDDIDRANRGKAGRCGSGGPDTGPVRAGNTAGGTGAGKAGVEGAEDPKTDQPVDSAINPEEVNAAIAGHLLVRVTERTEDRPLPGCNVFFPVRGSKLEAEGGDVKVDASLSGLRKRTNKFGACIWSAAELAKLAGKEPQDPALKGTSVLVTQTGYADLFEPLAIPDLSKGAEVTLKMFSAVRVTGKVRERRGGIVKHIKLDVLQTSGQGAGAPQNRFTVEVDGIGEFAMKVADAFVYRFEVKAAGYAAYTSRDFDFRRDEREVSIILEPARGISGVVTGAGKPVEGAKVSAPNDGMTVFTDAEGKFAFDMVADRIWTNDVILRFSAKGFAPQNKSVLANDHAVKVELLSEGTLVAQVVNSKGDPVPGTSVSCTYIEGQARYPYDNEISDEQGKVKFGGFGEGRVVLTASFEDLASDPVALDVKPGFAAGEAKLLLRTAATVTGRVTSGGSPVMGATVALDGKPATATDADGNYSLGGMQPGDHTVKILNQFPISDEQIRQLPVFTTDGKTFYYLPAERKLKLKLAAQEVVDFDCQAFDAKVDRKITVKISTQPREAVTGVQVTVKPILGAPPAGVEAPKTMLIALDMPEGAKDLALSLLDGVTYELSLVHNRYFTATLSPSALAGVPDGGSIEVTLERAFIIKGYVKDSEGNGLENVGLSKDRNNPWAQGATTDIHGYFEFGQLREDSYLITAFKTAYYQEKVEVKIEGRDPDPLEIKLVGANEIRIVVKDGGTPQAGAHILIYRNDAEGENPDDYKRPFDIGTTDANGEKYINFHWIRNYQIVATLGGKIAYTNFNNVAEVPEREVVIDLETAFTLKGSVIDADSQVALSGVTIRAHAAAGGPPGLEGNFFQVETDSAGNFSASVPSGNFWFYVPQTASHKALSTQGSNVPAGASNIVLQVVVRDDIQGNYAQIISFTTPTQMVAGQPYEVEVQVKNMGSTTWSSAGQQPWRLGSQAPRDNTRWGMGRVPIADGIEVAPKQIYTFRFTVTAPTKAGTYDMQWQMVQDGKEWFGQVTQKLQVTVTPADPG